MGDDPFPMLGFPAEAVSVIQIGPIPWFYSCRPCEGVSVIVIPAEDEFAIAFWAAGKITRRARADCPLQVQALIHHFVSTWHDCFDDNPPK